MGSSPTFKDVARVAGVSLATVSRCVNTPELVSEETRERVEQAMENLHYRYNSLARSFATRTSRTLGVVLPSITNPVFAESTRGIQDAVAERDYQIFLANTDYDRDKEFPLIRNMRQHQIDGLILTSSGLASKSGQPEGRGVQELLQDRFPCVLLYSTIRQGPLSSVGVDNVMGGEMAARYLWEQGHRHIAMLAGSFAMSDRSRDRYDGFKNFLMDKGCFKRTLVKEIGFDMGECNTALAGLFSVNERPTALFCSNDLLAVAAIAELREMGLDVPRDVSVMGFDDVSLAGFVSPGLTTIRQPVYEMGRLGAELLFDLLQNPEKEPAHKLLPLELVVRGTVAALGA